MANQQLFDRFSTTVSSSYTSGGGSLVLTSASGLPSGGNYYLIVQSEGANTEEVFLVTSRSGTTLTVTGAQWNTSASNHASTAVVLAPIFGSDFFKGFTQDIIMRGTRASLPASGPPASRAVYKCSDSPYEFFWDGSNWKASVFGRAVTEPAIGSWTAISSPTTVTTYGGILLTAPAHSGAQLRLMSIATPSTPYTIIATFLPTVGDSEGVGVGWRASGSGKLVFFERQTSSDVSLDKWDSSAGINSNYATWTLAWPTGGHVVRLSDDGTNRKVEYSFDQGKTWFFIHQVGRTDFITPDQLVFGADAEFTVHDATIWLLGWD